MEKDIKELIQTQAEIEEIKLVCIADVKALNPKPLCHHKYILFKKNFKCSLCGRVAFLVSPNWHPPKGWTETEIDPATYEFSKRCSQEVMAV